MTNDKDLFSQINDLFEDVTVDQASDLIGEELAPSQSDYEKELIEKLNKNDFQLSDALIKEIKENIEQGGDVDRTLTEFLRQKFGLSANKAQRLTEEVLETPEEEEVQEEPVREDYITQYADGLGYVLKRDAMRSTWTAKDDPQMHGDIHERMDAFQAQLGILRASLTEQTMVSGIGQGGDGQGPGSGEVRINRMDDVDLGPDGVAGLNPGDVLVWDPECNKGEGCWVPQPGEDLGTDTSPVFGVVHSCRSLQSPGSLYWGTNSDYINGVTSNLIKTGVQKIDYAMSVEYDDNGNGTYTGTWLAFGAAGAGDVIITPTPQTAGTSGPNGPEGFYLLGAPCGDDTGTDGELLFGTIHGCKKFSQDAPGDLYYGTKDQQELGLGTLINTPGKVVEILQVFSESADPDSRIGNWTCIYNYIDGSGNIKQGNAEVVNQKDGPNDNGFYVLNGECIEPDGGDDSEIPKLGYIAGCSETADEEAPIKWGSKADAENGTGISVTTPDTMAKEILAVIGKEIDNTYTGEWTCVYRDKDGNEGTVTYEGTSSLVGPEGFFLETDNCASDLPPEGGEFAWGVKTGCDYVILGGDLTWGTKDDYTNGAGDVVASDARKIIAVYSASVDENNIGQWSCVYEDTNGDIKVADSPVDTESSPEYGFFIAGATCDGEEEGDGRPDNLKRGLITGCKELTAASGEGPLYWGSAEEYEAGMGLDTGKIGTKIEFVFSTNADETNTGDWTCVYRRSTNAAETHTQSGTSPADGFYLVGDCEVEGEVDGEGDNVLGLSNGCVRVIPKGMLYWGTEPDQPGEAIDSDVTQIVAIFGKNVYDNMYGEWYCVYKKGAGGNNLISEAHLGINPEESYYLIADTGGQCVEDGIDAEEPEQNRPNFGQTIGCFLSNSLAAGETSDVYWADNQSAIQLGNGVQKTTDGDIRKIISVLSFEEADTNGDREWTCIYQKFNGDYGFVVHTGKSPDGGYYLNTPKCADGAGEETPGDELVDFIRFGRPVGCDENLETDPGNLHWSNIVAVSSGEDGVVVDGDGDVLKLNFSFTLDRQFRSWNLFYQKVGGTAFVKYPSVATGETYRSWPWGFHIVDGVCVESELPDPDEPIEGDGSPIFGIITGCKSTETYGGRPLYWGTAEDVANDSGIHVSDPNGDPIMDAVRIVSVLSFNADSTRYGTWFAIYKTEAGEYKVATRVGRSPLTGYYLFTDECDGEAPLPGGECGDVADCPDGMVCVGGKCVLRPCDDDADCIAMGGTCVFGHCYKPCPPEGCPEGFECVDNPIIPGDTICVPGGEFPGGGDYPQCGDDNECPPGFQCVGGFCVQLPCDKDGVCPDGLECVFGHCYKPCDPTDPEPCPPGFTCIEALPGKFICVIGNWPPGGELPDTDGPGGGDCTDDLDCLSGYTCVEGTCVLLPCPPGGCPPGTICIGGHCYEGCDINGGCADGFTCLEILGEKICVPGNELPGGGECDVDNPCWPGYVCVGGICVPEECPGGTTDCEEDGICYDGHCYRPCPPEGCPPGFTCVSIPGTGDVCMPIGGGGNCSIDDDCKDGFICVDGYCVPKRCDNDPDTECEPGYVCFDGVCYHKCGENGYECPPGFICVNIGNDTICMPAGGGGENGCWRDEDCDPGYECVDGTCLPIGCSIDNDCPDGFVCHNGRCYQLCSDLKPCPDGYVCIDPDGSGDTICVPVGPPGGGDGNDELDDLYFGYLPGCKTTGDTAANLKFGTAQTPAGDLVLENDAKSIVFSFAVDDGTPNSSYDPETGIGDWTCVYRNASNGVSTHLENNAGPSPMEGYYLDTLNCEEEGANLPVDPEEVSTQPIGCHKSSPACTLKWGTAEQVVDGSGTDVVDTGVEEILYTGYKNSYENGFADQIVIYKKTSRSTPIQKIIFRQNPDAEGEKGFYLDVVADNCQCVGTGDEHSPTLGLITGCREVSRNGRLYWGTREDYSNLINELDTPSSTPAHDLGVDAKMILAVVSTDSDENGLGNWDINYKTFSDEISQTSYFGQSPEGGAFILPDDNSVCLYTGEEGKPIYTDEVILRKVDQLNDTSKKLYELKGGIQRPAFEHQDSANLFFSQEVYDLNRLKPTMIVAEFTGDSDTNPQVPPDYSVEGVPFDYLPVQGDLWLDPTTNAKGQENILRAAIVDRTNLDPNNPNIGDLDVKWVVVAGDGVTGGGANTTDEVFLINTIRFYQKYSAIIPLTPEEFADFFPLVTQEDANLLNVDMLVKLQELKPTIHITPEIYSIPNYHPMRGDIWVDPTDYSMYVCDISDVDNPPNLILNPSNGYPYEDANGNYLYWVEIGGDGAGGNRVYVQLDPPDHPIKGDLWVDQADYFTYVYSPEKSWVALTGDQSAMGKRFRVHVDVKPPVDFREWEIGDLWFDTEDSEMRIWLGNELGGGNWVPVNNGGVDRRKAIFEQSLRDLNMKFQKLNDRLQQLEGNLNPNTEGFTFPQNIESYDNPGNVDPGQTY